MKDIQRQGKEHGYLPDEKWQAIISNDASYNDKFFYAVKTTGIFCRPSCRSREPKKENVRIFLTAEEALSENFRPCKRCKPTGQRLPDVEWVAQITDYIKKNYSETLTLESLADICHGSPYHMHRTFKRIMGITPIEYIQQTRINKAMVYLIQSDKTIADIAMTVGMPNTPYFITLFKKVTGYTPKKFRQLNKNTQTMEVLQSGSKK
ncbi:bifunctional transcriptional activator/DNA repair enzyme AdaA [Brevibacillus laterosporus]|uniref:bifunctional transcriptional activator/DNA repair enzyme AdaA n=1 Tax=Brevibacillus laterosporus TaxID=1465 RepID=UPI0018CD635C|nr:bifunctional transcriptional activator/DNA repair enzyme AdaA [Brevibacillus laterosporus]MBG9797798.1 AraC family transcriptional regulator [Brevibacillus laterosporus]MCR8939623.1 bifunctional transcriptional activator/DNA repair enzyme AdaA [Brevibacillus laterosporus]MCZ0842263.1 bifunctional transcriptional activator/DNA repair enzyme AdaA [Brevibacillus laterosporus]MCZ0846206.1 bifunctional transcriptional activator/DNA repair enzyme AdaA [Brevibacillus laterosporus]MED1912655.1 bifu